ncbi:hypothetical protein WN51_06054 [Melipona quadrifasciata]|uniref:Uncharacterized protein n=1 Tax=Melipona quadrifasciata TaxID=166423 RepID=A0A0M8ZNZ4_9HYME|nr:hypothetical protein WN51_06054 [Melipona quadrifasciata]
MFQVIIEAQSIMAVGKKFKSSIVRKPVQTAHQILKDRSKTNLENLQTDLRTNFVKDVHFELIKFPRENPPLPLPLSSFPSNHSYSHSIDLGEDSSDSRKEASRPEYQISIDFVSRLLALWYIKRRRAPRLGTRELDIVGDQVTRVVPGVALGVAWRVDAYERVGQDGGAGGVGGFCSLTARWNMDEAVEYPQTTYNRQLVVFACLAVATARAGIAHGPGIALAGGHGLGLGGLGLAAGGGASLSGGLAAGAGSARSLQEGASSLGSSSLGVSYAAGSAAAAGAAGIQQIVSGGVIGGRADIGPAEGPKANVGPQSGPSDLVGPQEGAKNVGGPRTGPAGLVGPATGPFTSVGASAGTSTLVGPSQGTANLVGPSVGGVNFYAGSGNINGDDGSSGSAAAGAPSALGGAAGLGGAGLALGGAGLYSGAIAVVGGGAGIGAGIGGHDGGVAVINGPSGAIHAGLGSHGAIIPAALGKNAKTIQYLRLEVCHLFNVSVWNSTIDTVPLSVHHAFLKKKGTEFETHEDLESARNHRAGNGPADPGERAIDIPESSLRDYTCRDLGCLETVANLRFTYGELTVIYRRILIKVKDIHV